VRIRNNTLFNKIFKRLKKKIMIKKISEIFSILIPTTNILVFNSVPDFSDNAYAMYNYIVKRPAYNIYKLVWLVSSKEKVKTLTNLLNKGQNTLVVYKYSLRGIWFYYRAKYIFCTHGLFNNLSLKQKAKYINLWHGMPLKVIGYMDNFQEGNYPIRVDVTIATSDSFRKIMAKIFDISEEKVLLTGLPRNDMLFEKSSFFEKYNIKKENYKKTGIWLPTYRKSILGENREDGVYIDGRISFLGEEELAELDDYLGVNEVFLIIKIHRMDALQKYSFKSYKNIMIIKELSEEIQLYPLLGNSDFLLTDYSSVWVDYDILKKPIGFVMNDVEEYKNSRGFTFDNMINILPGEILMNMNQIKDFLLKMDDYPYKDSDLFNKYKDNLSTERLMKKLHIEKHIEFK
jgi:CDP-glycerol glycerophosphotransferase (TagB/SpsB family)